MVWSRKVGLLLASSSLLDRGNIFDYNATANFLRDLILMFSCFFLPARWGSKCSVRTIISLIVMQLQISNFKFQHNKVWLPIDSCFCPRIAIPRTRASIGLFLFSSFLCPEQFFSGGSELHFGFILQPGNSIVFPLPTAPRVTEFAHKRVVWN